MPSAATPILSQHGAADPHSSELLFRLVYRELRQLAACRLRMERPGQTLQATALVHEAYLRLVRPGNGSTAKIWDSRSQFFAAAAEAMRRILVENARRKGRQKRGGGLARLDNDVTSLPDAPASADLLDVEEALTELESEHPDKALVVKLRYFVGLTICECAEVLGVSTPTVERRWAYARAWLAHRLIDAP
jgi:RNA polymerase sigma factor (TIGR02999 family)